MSESININRKAVADALYELEHLIREEIPQGDIRYPGAKRRLDALRNAYTVATTPASSPASSWEGQVDRQGGSFTEQEILDSIRGGGW